MENSIFEIVFSGRNVVENNATKSLILDEITIGFPSLSFIKPLKIYDFRQESRIFIVNLLKTFLENLLEGRGPEKIVKAPPGSEASG